MVASGDRNPPTRVLRRFAVARISGAPCLGPYICCLQNIGMAERRYSPTFVHSYAIRITMWVKERSLACELLVALPMATLVGHLADLRSIG